MARGPTPKLIMLEGMKAWQVKGLIFVMWAVVGIAISVTVLEQEYLRADYKVAGGNCYPQLGERLCVYWQGLNCSLEPPHHHNDTNLTSSSSFPHKDVSVSPSPLYIGDAVTDYSNSEQETLFYSSHAYQAFVQQRSTVFGNITGISPFNAFFAIQASFSRSSKQNGTNSDIGYQVDIQGLKKDGFQEVANVSDTLNLNCPKSNFVCQQRTIYFSTFPLRSKEYKIAINFDRDMCDYIGNVDLAVNILQSQWGYSLMTGRYILFGITCFGAFIWFYHLYKCRFTWRTLLPEQRWISLAIVVVIIFNDPLYLLRIYRGGAWTDVALAIYCFGTTTFLTFWLVLIHGLSRTGAISWSFYAPKFLFFVAFFVCSFLRLYSMLHSQPFSSSTFEQLGGYYVIPVAMLSIMWLVWFLWSVISTRKHLKKLPYLATRFRQLCFYFFLWQSVLVILFLAVVEAVSFFVTNTYFYSVQNFESFGELLLYDAYFWLVALCYAPLRSAPKFRLSRTSLTQAMLEHSQHNTDVADGSYVLWEMEMPEAHKVSNLKQANAEESNSSIRSVVRFVREALLRELFIGREPGLFCVETATKALDLSWQAYYDPEGYTTASSWGAADLTNWDVVAFHSDPNLDVHCLITTEKAYENLALPASAIPYVQGPKRLWVTFRGTASKKNLLTDLKFTRVKLMESLGGTFLAEGRSLWQTISGLPFRLEGAQVHSGFWEAYKGVAGQVISSIREYQAKSPCEVILTGHSLGGALAVFAAMELRISLGSNLPITMMSFGAPRVGNHAFAELYNLAVPNSYRLVFESDVITDIPKFFIYFKHVGVEVLTDRYGNIIIGPSFVEKFFRSSRRSIRDHRLQMYRSALEKALEIDEAPLGEDDEPSGTSVVQTKQAKGGLSEISINATLQAGQLSRAGQVDGITSPIRQSLNVQRRTPVTSPRAAGRSLLSSPTVEGPNSHSFL